MRKFSRQELKGKSQTRSASDRGRRDRPGPRKTEVTEVLYCVTQQSMINVDSLQSPNNERETGKATHIHRFTDLIIAPTPTHGSIWLGRCGLYSPGESPFSVRRWIRHERQILNATSQSPFNNSGPRLIFGTLFAESRPL